MPTRRPLTVPLCLAAAVSIACAALGTAAEPPASAPTTAPAASLDARLADVDARAGAHRDLAARFTQEKRSPMLQQPLVTRGTVHARGEVTLWASDQPEPSRMRIDPQSMRIYYPKQNLIEQYSVQSKLGAMATSPLPRLATLRERFSIRLDDGKPLADPIAADAVQIRLEPTDPEIRPYVDHVRVLLDASRGLVRAFEVVDADGEATTLRFEDVRTDTGFADGELALNAPAGTRVTRPLEAK